MNQLKDTLLGELSSKNMLETVKSFNHLHRYSGTPDGEEAARILGEKLEQYGVPYEVCVYDGFFSRPLSAFLTAEGNTYPLVGDVYSREADGLLGELYYDSLSTEKGLTQLEESRRFAAFKDKIVLTWDGKGDFAKRALESGALAILHICPTRGNYIHHSNIGSVWGTPGLDEAVYMKFLPSAGIRRADGEALAKLLGRSTVAGELSVRMETGIKSSTMVVAEIPGSDDNFILVSGHYDSWYEGITDNAVSDAILLEYARILYSHRGSLNRGIKLAWWSGHSDGRFAGSAWYCDSHYKELKKHCAAHVNLDLTGCKNSDQISVRTACTEGLDFTGDLIEKYTGRRPKGYLAMVRGADQSFWGAQVPITIMLKYEPLKEKRCADCPGGGPWWHTPQDTLDKLDERIMLRDAAINLEIIEILQGTKVLPVRPAEFMEDLDRRLNRLLDLLPGDFDCRSLREVWPRVKTAFSRLDDLVHQENVSDEDIKETVGKLLHLVYCRRDPYTHDVGSVFGIFGAIAQFSAVTGENTEKAYYVMAKSDFMRYQNRLCDGLEAIIERAERIKAQ